jgi:hypothetical protein
MLDVNKLNFGRGKRLDGHCQTLGAAAAAAAILSLAIGRSKIDMLFTDNSGLYNLDTCQAEN